MGYELAEMDPVTMTKPQFAQRPSAISTMARGLIGSEILKIAADIRTMVAEGHAICNLTVGDFNPAYFPIPTELRASIQGMLDAGETNYPPSDGMMQLRRAVKSFYERRLGLDYPIESFIITSGARPAIYATYNALIEEGDKVVYPIPSWNNNHYTHLSRATYQTAICRAEDAFLPTRDILEGTLTDAKMLSLCSPLNPTGTAFTREALEGICDLVIEENASRESHERPLFIMYDQVYWMLTFGDTVHYNPVSLRPELASNTIFVDGISKAFAATGVRVGWCVAPPDIAGAMSNILGHIGAWAPRAEQLATAALLLDEDAIQTYHSLMIREIEVRLDALYDGLTAMQRSGLPVDAITPMGAIYLTARFDLIGRRTPSGKTLATNEDIRKYLLESARLAVVPFQAFGSQENTGWFRLSVGAVSMDEIETMLPRLRDSLEAL
ncbi:MAG: aminotransferase class I/II-fold pyridoxal phosphate-dependent enzyme [Bacteroidota bacterium]|nr:aminotransferase class I/II-fold pyridoxal phosphate-dependent enzyme [Bacteroidota bacterium]MDP4234125.1 aminotransferase class I/II-fold pyridoxal phosphate-dependent enzyme [Bacteroidota bacterium]MDP4243066.1 aminotransferase class I/II-fold pyridoxal phosphate-dependent enzyme [Bacteroidota bacterium]MDP4287492.1 aminotransferase class I/II-fold pyridoxal phosphate-dependent enzyme [Bacteroidota bacterium]